MNNGANGTITTCSGTFVDDGGGGNYANNQNSTITFCPSTPGDLIRVVFTTFDTEGAAGLCTDYLDVWYGNAVGAVGTNDDRLCGALGTATFISTSPDGCISFQFISNNSIISRLLFAISFTSNDSFSISTFAPAFCNDNNRGFLSSLTSPCTLTLTFASPCFADTCLS